MAGSDSELPSDIAPTDGVEAVDGIGPTYGSRLRENGYDDVESLQGATTEELSEHMPLNVANDVKAAVGDKVEAVPTIAAAKEKAQQRPGAKAKMVKVNGKQRAKILDKVAEEQTGGATLEIHKG